MNTTCWRVKADQRIDRQDPDAHSTFREVQQFVQNGTCLSSLRSFGPKGVPMRLWQARTRTSMFSTISSNLSGCRMVFNSINTLTKTRCSLFRYVKYLIQILLILEIESHWGYACGQASFCGLNFFEALTKIFFRPNYDVYADITCKHWKMRYIFSTTVSNLR